MTEPPQTQFRAERNRTNGFPRGEAVFVRRSSAAWLRILSAQRGRIQFFRKPSAQTFSSTADAEARKRLPSFMSAPGQDGASYADVPPIPLLPEVAKGMTVLPCKSHFSRNEFIIVGATYHQIGKPTNTVS